MKAGKYILLLLVLFCFVDLKSQTQQDSLSNAKDSVSLTKDSVPAIMPVIVVPRDSVSFKRQYKRGVLYTINTNLDISYKGFIVDETEYTIVVEDRQSLERIELRKGEIKSAKIFTNKESFVNYVGENYHARNYMAATSAFLFKPEELTSNYNWFIFEDLDYAFSKNFAIGANSLGFYPVSVGAKLNFKLDKNTHIGASAFAYGALNIFSNLGFLFIGYSANVKCTRGNTNENITVTGGVLGIRSEFYTLNPVTNPYQNLFYANAAYCNRLSERVTLNLEGWYIPEAQIGFAGAGIKLIKQASSSWTFGCFGIVNFQTTIVTFNYKAIPIPYIGYSQKF